MFKNMSGKGSTSANMGHSFQPYDHSHKAKTKRIGHTCKICGKRESAEWSSETNERLISNQICLNCDLWIRTISQDAINPIWYGKLVIDGKRWIAKPFINNNQIVDTPIILLENISTGERLPFYGLKIDEVIPDYFLSAFPDNARIVTDDPDFPLVDGVC